MKIDIFALCDSVQCYDNKLIVIGVYDVLLLQNFAAAPVTINIAAHVLFESEECGANKISLECVNMENGDKILSLNQPVEIAKREGIDTGMLNVALAGVPVLFTRQGKYKFTLSVEGRGEAHLVLNVLPSHP